MGGEGFEPRPTRCKRVALPAELTTLFILQSRNLWNGTKYNADSVMEPAFEIIEPF